MLNKLILLLMISGLSLHAELSAYQYASGKVKPDTIMFLFNDFSDLSKWQLNNHAKGAVDSANRHVLRLTDSKIGQFGSAFIKDAVPLVGPTGFKGSFSAFFSFRLHSSDGLSDGDGMGADGIVFVVQTIANNVGMNGGGIGYQSIQRSLGIEFDTWENDEEWALDPDGNHVGIDTGGSTISIKTYKVKKRLNDSSIWYAWIDYNGDSSLLEIRLDTINVRPANPILTHSIVLTSILKLENAFVGFTSATGSAFCTHDILTFKFINVFIPFAKNLIDNQTFSIMENSLAGRLVGTVATVPSVPGQLFLSQLMGVPEFNFNSVNRNITVANSALLDFEKQNQYHLILQALKLDTLISMKVDSTFDTAKITINILDTLELPDPANIDSAVIFDIDGNGIGDSIICHFDNAPVQWLPEKVMFNWPAFTPQITVSTTTTQVNGRQISFRFNPALNAPVLTTGDGVIKARYDSLSTIVEKSGPLYDGIGPLLKNKAQLIQRYIPDKDTFFVSFTEKVAVSEITGKSFILIKKGNKKEIELTLLDKAVDLGGEVSIRFAIADLSGAAPRAGDSLKILHTGSVVDNPRRNHAHNNNTSVPIVLIERPVSVTIVKGYYFDKTADGYIDSIYVEATTDLPGGFTNVLVKEIVDNSIKLPQFRNFTITNSGVVSGGFFIKVTENIEHNPFTYITDNDKLSVSNYKLLMGGEVLGGIYPMYDRIAPLIHWDVKSAYLIDYMVDTIADILTIKFSEPVKRVTAIEPFYFLDKDKNTNYTVNLFDAGQPETDKMVFNVTSLSGVDYMEDGDSIWIKETDQVCDAEGNCQNNFRNTHRRLYVNRIALPYMYVPKAISPVSLKDMTTVNKIPTEIVTVLNNSGILNNLNLQNSGGGNYSGMMIIAVPEPWNIGQFIPDLKLTGTLTILDALGNILVSKEKMAWWDQKKCLVWVWNCKNGKRRSVGRGIYLCFIKLEDSTKWLGNDNQPLKKIVKITIGVK